VTVSQKESVSKTEGRVTGGRRAHSTFFIALTYPERFKSCCWLPLDIGQRESRSLLIINASVESILSRPCQGAATGRMRRRRGHVQVWLYIYRVMGIPHGEVSSIDRRHWEPWVARTSSTVSLGLLQSARWFWQRTSHSTDRQTAGVCWSTWPILVYSFCMKVRTIRWSILRPAHASIWRRIFLQHAVACIDVFFSN
jgi:hypothetical protein